ncbi:MAG TPA: urea carboxylase-associated family protein [Thermomicrobiaceae bacterium]|nr:urea carboxylase-associated family protein [Thermomicrobiaceae bacterium]
MVLGNDILSGRIARRAAQIRPGKADVFTILEGQYLQITDMEGKQVAELVAFNADDRDEVLSTAHTRAINNSIMLVKGMNLYSNRRTAMFVVVEDTVGRHDLLMPSCDRRRYENDYGLAEHPGCREALDLELRAAGHEMPVDRIPDPVNFFMNVGLRARGELEVREPLSERNDYVLLRALMPMIVGVAACPQEQSAATGFNPSDILIRVYM